MIINTRKLAIDFQGTLDCYPILIEMAHDLLKQGWEVIILSAMPITMRGIREKEIEQFCDLPYKVVYHELENYHEAAGREKVKWMKDHDYLTLIDDNPEVARVLGKNGLLCMKINLDS